MSNGELAAILSTAALGGFFGAVAQPLVTHLLASRERRADDVRETERGLRRMVNAELAYGRRLFAALAIVQLHGIGVVREARDGVVPPRVVWRSERIRNKEFASTGRAYAKVCSEMRLALVAAEYGALPSIEAIKDFVDRFMPLEEEMNIGMDDLGWPSVDEQEP